MRTVATPLLDIIRLLTTSNADVLLEHERILNKRYGLRSLTRCIPAQPNGIFDAESEAVAVPRILTRGRELVDAGCGALFLSCTAVAVIGIGAAAPAPFRALLGQDVPYARPRGVTQTTGLLKPEGLQSAVDCAEGLMKAGAHVIAFSCTGFSTIRLAPVLRERLGCVAVDAAGMFAVEMLGITS